MGNGLNDEAIQLFRPVGQFEYQLIAATNFTKFPPRLSWQPIFYPVLNFEYAAKIARDWNTKDPASGFIGYVTAFQISKDYFETFEVHVVGGSICRELWVPSADLEIFNAHILSGIAIIETFIGEGHDESAKMPDYLR